jgi:hypothetical protein
VPDLGTTVTLSDAIDEFVGGRKDGTETRQTLARFLRWFGDERIVTSITPADLEAFSQEASAETLGGGERIKAVRDFLQYARKSGIVDSNLSQHVKLRRPTKQSRGRSARPGAQEPEVVQLTGRPKAGTSAVAPCAGSRPPREPS